MATSFDDLVKSYPLSATATPLQRLGKLKAHITQLEALLKTAEPPEGCVVAYVCAMERLIARVSERMPERAGTKRARSDPTSAVPCATMAIAHADGPFERKAAPETGLLEALQAAIGGHVEMVDPSEFAISPKGRDPGVVLRIYVDEEGALKKLPVNTHLAPFVKRPVYGTAVLLWEKEEEEKK